MTGWSSRRYVSSDLDERPPRRLARRRLERLVGEPDLGQLEAPVAVLAPDRVVEEPGHLAEREVGDGLVDRRGRGGGARQQPALGRAEVAGVGQPPLGIGRDRRPAVRRRRTAPRSRACWRSCGRSRAWPARTAGPARASAPWMSANRSASAPVSSMTAERVDDVALRLGHLLALGSRMRPER